MFEVKMLEYSTNASLILDTDASRFYEEIKPHVEKEEAIVLDMQGINFAVTSYFNASIGYLYKIREDAEKYVIMKNGDDNFLSQINRVMKNAKSFYINSVSYTDIDSL